VPRRNAASPHEGKNAVTTTLIENPILSPTAETGEGRVDEYVEKGTALPLIGGRKQSAHSSLESRMDKEKRGGSADIREAF